MKAKARTPGWPDDADYTWQFIPLLRLDRAPFLSQDRWPGDGWPGIIAAAASGRVSGRWGGQIGDHDHCIHMAWPSIV